MGKVTAQNSSQASFICWLDREVAKTYHLQDLRLCSDLGEAEPGPHARQRRTAHTAGAGSCRARFEVCRVSKDADAGHQMHVLRWHAREI